jgi:hypothetical protein
MSKNIGKDIARIAELETETAVGTDALISTCYHLMRGAERLSMLAEDAEEDGDKEIARFLAETRAEFIRRAEFGKKLLAENL